jgi:ubiquinone/menaquinone biosynthesis C-methylase UbiE
MADSFMTKLSFDSGASAWDRFSVWASAVNVQALLAAAEITAGQRVLDVATGAGPFALEAAALIGPSGLVLGTDISLPMLARAKRHAERLPVSLVAMDGQALACRDASFDAVICLLGLMFFANVARGLAEFRRVLRPAVRVAVCVTTTRTGQCTEESSNSLNGICLQGGPAWRGTLRSVIRTGSKLCSLTRPSGMSA